jgi:hypothetical protein
VAGVQRGDELGDLLGRVLQVAVQSRDEVPARLLEAGEQRRVLTVVAVEFDDFDPQVLGESLEQVEGPVRATVVDEDQLPRAPERVQRGDQPAVQLGNAGGFVVDRHDDRQLRAQRDLVGLLPARPVPSPRVQFAHPAPDLPSTSELQRLAAKH